MNCLLGIDLGTSSVKAIIISTKGQIMSLGQKEYAFDVPFEGWAEQDPEVWWNATVVSIRQALASTTIHANDILSIGFSGQMHGLVALDKNNKPVRKAIIWNDQRSKEQVRNIERIVGRDNLGSIAHSPIATGFQTASLLWMKENEPKLFEKTTTVILPKDYIRYRLTGEIGTDITDAASTLGMDCNNGIWSETILESIGIGMDRYPTISYPHEIAGAVTHEASIVTGLLKDTPVVFGGADQVIQALGNSIIENGTVSITIGTGGQVLMPLRGNVYDKSLRSHAFNFLFPDSWYYMGASLSSGLSLRWARSIMDPTESYKTIDEKAFLVPPLSEGVMFLPYLTGERTPHMDPDARAMFFGLTIKHTRYHLLRAIMEGAVYSLKESLEILTNEMNQDCHRVIASGGGSQSSLWLQIQADILGLDIYVSKTKEQAGVGAAMVAGLGVGVYESYKEACEKVVKWVEEPITPIRENAKRYEEGFQLFKDLYESNKTHMKTCGKLSQ